MNPSGNGWARPSFAPNWLKIGWKSRTLLY